MEDKKWILKWIYELDAEVQQLEYSERSRSLLPGWDKAGHRAQLRTKREILDGLRAIQPKTNQKVN